ncbi:hypothetical protein N864_23585 [Intrasporangium chromatireducens Q5-1]|uniref:Uncharacterized protein n=1 Tax=Intrasporangium chromatireducens Q5-1 TaxID=584657 RepID=W9GSG0_9MICO|nr:hypothetical protein [Intrasporangium chromatireducens]EWT07768.1 hypothetical protein N864_23585 [Intrasporangium chromatireducens Q5-1]
MALIVAVLTITSFLSLPQVAFAHGDEGAVPARESVLQALAYVVNTPDNMDAITDKLKDAQESADQSGVNLAAVKRAMTALSAGNMRQVRTLLEQSIGAKVDLTGLNVRHVLQVPPGLASVSLATEEQPGTQTVTDELPGRGPLTGIDATLLGLALLAAVAGVFLGARFRPEHSIHDLRRRARQSQAG